MNPPEAAVIEAALDAAQAATPEAWAALVPCRVVEVHTGGAAPGVSGAGAGCAAVVQGFTTEGRRPPAPVPAAQLTLAVPLAPGGLDPALRAALAGIVLGQAALVRLATEGWGSPRVTLWTGDQAAAQAPAPGAAPAHADLWALLRHQQHLLRWAVPGGLRTAWLPPQEQPRDDAGTLALEVAFRGNGAALARYRALHGRPAPAAPPGPARQPPLDTDYTLVLGDAPAVGALAGTPVYRLWTRDGRSREGYGAPGGGGAGAEAAAWASAQAALEDLVTRIERRRRDPARYSLTVYSSQEAVVAALREIAPAAPASRRRVAALLAHFGTARVLWQPAPLLAAWLAREVQPENK